MKQQNLFIEKVPLSFGGSLLKGRRKARRPLDSKRPLHLILKAEESVILFRHVLKIEEIIRRQNQRFGVQQYSLAIHADHIHFVVKTPQREIYRRWIRALTGVLARKMKIKWRLRPFTRLMCWGRDFINSLSYLRSNNLEASFILGAHRSVDQFKLGVSPRPECG